jgi:hypothetical protein
VGWLRSLIQFNLTKRMAQSVGLVIGYFPQEEAPTFEQVFD